MKNTNQSCCQNNSIPNKNNKSAKNKSSLKSKNSKLNIFFANADTLSNKKLELELVLNQYNIDIAFICETEPKQQSSSLPPTSLVIQGYDSFSNKTGRGVMMLYKEHLEVALIENINNIYAPSIFVKVTSAKKVLNLGTIYRSPNISKEEDLKLNSQVNKATKTLKNLYIYGDFNHPEIDWINMNCNMKEDHAASMFLHTIEECKLDQLITENTHYKPNCKPSLIDLIVTNNKDISSNPKLLPPLGKSHHVSLLHKINFNIQDIQRATKIKKYQTSKGDYKAINEELNNIQWETEFQNKAEDVNEVWNILSAKIKELRDKFVPVIYISSIKRKKRSDMNNSLLQLTREKRFFYKKYKKYRSQTNYLLYCMARAKVNKRIRSDRRMKERNIAKNMKSNPKSFYQYIASKTTKKDSIPDLIKPDGTKTSNDEEKSSELNNFFSSVFTVENDSHMPVFESKVSKDKEIDSVSVTEEEMNNLLKNLKPNKSPGTDEIHPHLLRECAKSLAKPMKYLFDLTMKYNVIPDEWKQAEIRPIYKKKGSKSDPSNYRPVSLTSVTCKLFEKVIKNKLCEHLISNNLLSPHQFGFIPGRSTDTQLLVTIKEWQKSLDNAIPTDVAYLDFRKAFDAVPHKRLLYKLSQYGIKGDLLLWIKSFLSNRSQYVKINNAKSVVRPVTSGVPQGSVLGPMLFIYFINDLPEVCSVSTKIYADDTKSYTEIKSLQDRDNLQYSIDQMFRWTQEWQLNFNQSKCKILHIGENNPKYVYFMGNGTSRAEIETTSLEKDLGLLVDTELNFESHIDYIIKKASQKKATILRNFTFRSKKVLVPLFKTLVRPILEYVDTVWDPRLRSQIKLLEEVQRKFTRHILEVKKFAYEDRLEKLKLPSLEFRRFRGDLIQMYKIAHKHYDRASVNSLFSFATKSRLRGHSYKITKFMTKKCQFQHFFTNRIVNHWNNLSEDIVNSKNLNIFKNKIDNEFSAMMFKTNIFS